MNISGLKKQQLLDKFEDKISFQLIKKQWTKFYIKKHSTCYTAVLIYSYLMKEISPSESQVLLTHFDWNLQRLAEVLKQEQNDYFKGAALQRFRHTYDIAIKVIRSIAQWKNLSCQTDEQCFETALENGWLEKQLCWTEMIEDYQRINQKPQTDTENVYLKLTAYHKAFSHLFTHLKTIA
ncbi:uncharacterized protein METZ01_LOCUS58737 [marine metagenome]|uniref:Uncharacterized protein n=1 Tax=marine metagenome TaxID=408172 RepID=A0A381SX03_9ZZZZ